jgi:lipopolysaccharide assembly protein A
MRGVKRVALVLIVLIVALAILAFVLENQQDVALAFLGGLRRSCRCRCL